MPVLRAMATTIWDGTSWTRSTPSCSVLRTLWYARALVNGTHAIAAALFGVLRPGDVLVSAVGAPYDTLLGVIGVTDKGSGSLKDFGVGYRQVDLTAENTPDLEGLGKAVDDPKVKAVLIQRSKGYSTRASLSVDEIGSYAPLSAG